MPTTSQDTPSLTRFEFGKNWLSFVKLVDDARIKSAGDSLLAALGVSTLSGYTFVDVGCGSGLFSLAACRLGARVRSFDYDPESVRATNELRRKFAPESDWIIERGSILDQGFTSALGRYDVVYSWGVLHHTGELLTAMEAASRLVTPGGLLYLSIYNDQGRASKAWRAVKRQYNTSGTLVRGLLVAGAAAYFSRHRPVHAIRQLIAPHASSSASRTRGMSRRHDLIDWVGGYPFEVAKPEEIFDFFRHRRFELRFLKTCGGGIGCNEYVFQAAPSAQAATGYDAQAVVAPD